MAQTDSEPLDGPRVQPKTGGVPGHLVVFLHGVGADGQDLIQLAPMLEDILPDAAFVSPHAPDPFDFAPAGRQWFSFMDDTPGAIDREVQRITPRIDRFLDDELARTGLTPDKLAVVGFSQGGIVALQSGLRRRPPIGALVGLSTILPNAQALPGEITSKPPVLLVHGDQDQVLPATYAEQSAQALSGLGVPVEKHILRGRGHEIDQEGLGLIRDFLSRHMAGG